MPTYRVEVPTTGFELYEVEADNEEQAIELATGAEGCLIASEVSFDMDSIRDGVVDVRLVEED